MTRLNPEQIKIMKDELTVELADWLMSTYGYSPSEALDVLYNYYGFKHLLSEECYENAVENGLIEKLW